MRTFIPRRFGPGQTLLTRSSPKSAERASVADGREHRTTLPTGNNARSHTGSPNAVNTKLTVENHASERPFFSPHLGKLTEQEKAQFLHYEQVMKTHLAPFLEFANIPMASYVRILCWRKWLILRINILAPDKSLRITRSRRVGSH